MLTAKENLLRAIYRQDPEWVPYGMEDTIWLYPPYWERPLASGLDDFGVRWNFHPDAEGGTYPDPDGYPIRDLANWKEQLCLPDVNALDWEDIKLGFTGKRISLSSCDRSKYLVCGIIEMGLFERSYLLLGMQNAMLSYATSPGLMYEMLGAVADFKIAVIERFHAEVGLDVISYGDDWGTQENLFISPRTWRQVIKPHTLRIYEAMKRLGLIIIQHSCGKISSIFEDMVELGPHVWNPCQPCNDLLVLKQKWGDRITFYGGIDSQFVLARPGVTAQEVRAEVRQRINDLAKGGGYIAAPSHSVPYQPELLFAMEDEIKVYGHEFYRKDGS
jgi:hypothetical protein